MNHHLNFKSLEAEFLKARNSADAMSIDTTQHKATTVLHIGECKYARTP
jgi:hypothetical protein